MEKQIVSLLFQDQKAVEIHCDDDRQDMGIGDIFIGRIQNIARNLNAAFVELAPGKNCYLPLDDLKRPFYTKKGASKSAQAGDELLVQICREGIKSKLPAGTTNLTLYGKYALLTTGNTQLSVSSKLPKAVREKLLAFLKTECAGDARWAVPAVICHQEAAKEKTGETVKAEDGHGQERPYGWLLRTNAGTASEALLRKDMERLRAQYETLIRQAPYRTQGSCLLETPAAYLTRLSNLYDTAAEKIVTDDEVLFSRLHEWLTQYQPEDLPKLSFYQDSLLPLKNLYSVENQLADALSERVWLPCGGYLVIQPTEALTVIDVNSGKYDTGKNKEAAFLKINREAAREAARQIRLRNVSGIILIDFINLASREAEMELLADLELWLRRDPVPTTLVDMTKLSLVEITRTKREKPLAQQITCNLFSKIPKK